MRNEAKGLMQSNLLNALKEAIEECDKAPNEFIRDRYFLAVGEIGCEIKRLSDMFITNQIKGGVNNGNNPKISK